MKLQKQDRRQHYIAFVAASVDGRISLAKKTMPTWTSKEDWQFFQNAISKADAVIVGRNTYEAAASRLRKRNTYVLSRRLKTIRRYKKVTFVNPLNVDIEAVLNPYKKIAVVGGSLVYSTLLEKKLIDEIFVTIEPLIFGRGQTMFVGCQKIFHLQLVSVKKLNPLGTLLLHYRVKYSL